MEYKSRHIQPFSLEQAVSLEIPVITAGLSDNSLEHLRDTQWQLREIIASERQPDPELALALRENDQVISSQEERISMLRLALEHKGLVNQANPHYDLHQPADTRPQGIEDSGVDNSSPAAASASAADGVFL